MKRILIPTIALLSIVSAASAQNLLNNTFTDHDFNNAEFSLNDTGWGAKEYWTQSGGGGLQVHAPGWATSVPAFGAHQTLSVGAATGDSLRLQFDWTPGVGATTPEDLTIHFQLFGWDTGGATPSATAVTVHGLNFYSTTIGGAGTSTPLPVGTETFDFLSGNNTVDASIFVNGSSGQVYPSTMDLVSTAGVTASFDQTFSIALAGQTDLSDYDYIGMRVMLPGTGTLGAAGGTLENISLTTVPEPGSYALIGGLLALGAVMVRRRK